MIELPIVLWNFGLIDLEQVGHIFDWYKENRLKPKTLALQFSTNLLGDFMKKGEPVEAISAKANVIDIFYVLLNLFSNENNGLYLDECSS